MDIIKLDPRQLRSASELLANTFFDYPRFTSYFPNPNRRARFLPWYFRNILRTALRFGEVYTTPDISGVILIIPPGKTKISILEYIQNGFLLTPFALGFKNYYRSMKCEDFVDKTRIELLNSRPHYYLWTLAVDVEKKAKGIGSALLQLAIDKANAQKLPIYLETHKEINVGYYIKHGFKLVHNACIPKIQLPIWCMLREPD